MSTKRNWYWRRQRKNEKPCLKRAYNSFQRYQKTVPSKEKLRLEKRRDLLNEGVAREMLKIRYFGLFNHGVKVDNNSESDAEKRE